MSDTGGDLFSFFEDANGPQVPEFEWMKSKVMELVTMDTLDAVVDACIAAGLYALDLETTGLDVRVYGGMTTDKTVGFCLAPDVDHGYYIPIRHRGEGEEHNLNIRVVEAALRRLVASDAIAVFHGGKFDHEMLQFNGGEPIGLWDDPKKFEDTNILAYIRNSRERNKQLKVLAETELGMEMIKLRQLFPEGHKGKLDFSMLSPTGKGVIKYGASDAICTLALFHHLRPQVLEKDEHGRSFGTPYHIEKKCLPATRWMERPRISIDRDKCAELIKLGQNEWLPALRACYAAVNKVLGRDATPGWVNLFFGATDHPGQEEYKLDPEQLMPFLGTRIDEARKQATRLHLDPKEDTAKGKIRTATIEKTVQSLVNPKKVEKVAFPLVYDVLKPAELGLLLREAKVQGLKATEKSGQVATGKDILEAVIERAAAKFPFLADVKRLREINKALSTNLLPVYRDSGPPFSPDSDIRINYNAHKVDTGRFSTPQPSKKVGWIGQVRWNLHSIPATYDPKRPKCMTRMRECIIARPNQVLAAIDYSGVELRIGTNLSHEPKWFAEFFRCSSCTKTFDPGTRPPPFCPKCGSDKIGDLHSLTGIAIYGEAALGHADWKQKRNNAKSTNFALLYGGGGQAVQRSVGVSKQEGWRIKSKFDATYPGLRAWWLVQHNFARQHEYVLTAFGRKYPVPDIKSEMGHFRSKAERNSVNGPIQGTSADLIKLAMALIYLACKKRGWLDKVQMLITIHDELVFGIDKDILDEALAVIVQIMTVEAARPLKHWKVPLMVDIELGFDWTVPWNLTEIRHGKCRFDGDKQIKKKGYEGNVPWENLPQWPTSLMPCFPEATGGTPYEVPSGNGAASSGDQKSGKDSPEESASAETSPSPATPEPTTPTPEPATPTPATPKPEQGPTLMVLPPAGNTFVHEVPPRALTMGLIERLARAIYQTRGRGTYPLRVEVQGTGEVLLDEAEGIIVNPREFNLMLARPLG